MGVFQSRASYREKPGAGLYALPPWWAFFFTWADEITFDRAGATWAVLAILLLIGCVITVLKWRYERKIAQHQRGVETLFSLTEQVLASSDREEVLRGVVRAAPELCSATHGYVLLASVQTRQLSYVASTDQLPKGGIPVNAIAGPVTCFRSRETTEVPDADDCPFIDKETVTKRKQKALLYAPLLAGDDCLGVLEIEDRKRKRGFSPEERAQAEHLARIAALGLRLVEQRRIIEQLHRTEKLAAVGELANAMSQELSVPFDQIRKVTDQVPFSAPAEDLQERLQEVTLQLDRAAVALERLVRFAAPTSDVTEEIDLNALLRRLVSDLRHRAEEDQVKIKLGLAKRTPLINADPTQIQQIFQILVRHALHFLKQIEGRSLQIYTARREDRVVVSMGPVAQPDQPLRMSLANRHGDAESMGSTLGLSVCQSLIERAGGSVQIERSATLGFRIEVEYPLSKDPWQATESEDFAATPSGQRAGPVTALIIDSDATVQEALIQALAEQSCRAVPADTAEEGLELAQRVRFDWVFCDMRLQPVTAAEVYEQLRDRVDRFVFLADDMSHSQGPEIFQQEGRAVLRKPFTGDDVERLLEELMRGSVVYQDG